MKRAIALLLIALQLPAFGGITVIGGGGGGASIADPLAIDDGGTNSTTALSNNRVMKSAGGAIVEAAAITAARALISDANGIPTHSSVTATTLAFLDATSSVQTQLDAKAPIASPTFTGQVTVQNGTAANPGLKFAGDADSGLFLSGTQVCTSRNGLVAFCANSQGGEFGLPSGAVQYVYSMNGQSFISYGLASTALKHTAKVGSTTEANTPLYATVNGGPFFKSTTATSNVGTGEDDLQSKNLPARFQFVNTSGAEEKAATLFKAWGTFANNGNTKRVRAYVGATQVGDCFDYSTAAASTWWLDVDFQSDELTNAQQIISRCTIDDGSGTSAHVRLFRAVGALDMGSLRAAKLTGEATADNDIVAEVLKLYYEPQGS